YAIMAAGRIVAALGSSLYTPLAFAIAASLVPEARRGRALSVVFGGMSVATALGLPLGTYLGRIGDWHVVFLVIAAIGVLNLVLLRSLLPSLSTSAATTLRERLAPVASSAVQIALALTFLIVMSEYSFYSYVSIVFGRAGAQSASVLPGVFLAFGVGAIIG